jgi:hypothetical protein
MQPDDSPLEAKFSNHQQGEQIDAKMLQVKATS